MYMTYLGRNLVTASDQSACFTASRKHELAARRAGLRLIYRVLATLWRRRTGIESRPNFDRPFFKLRVGCDAEEALPQTLTIASSPVESESFWQVHPELVMSRTIGTLNHKYPDT